MVTRALSGSLVRAMRSRYPEPGIRPRLLGRRPSPAGDGASPGCLIIRTVMIRNVSITSDGGRAGGRRARRWLVLAAGTVALTAGSARQYGLAYLIPALRANGRALARAGAH